MKSKIPWILFIVSYFGLRLYYLDLVPIWDGIGYYNLLVSAVQQPGHFIEKYSLVGHPSLAWALITSIPVRLFPGNIIAFNSLILSIDCLAVFAFYRLIRFYSVKGTAEIEKVLILACFAFNPFVLATQLNFSVDTGLLDFFVIYLWFWVERKYIWAVVVGCLMSLTKEPGIVFCLIFPILDFIFNSFIRNRNSVKDKAPYWFLIGLPLICFGSVVYLKSIAPGHQLSWHDNPLTVKETILLLLNPFMLGKNEVNTQQDFLFFTFISNFFWIISTLLFLFVLIRFGRKFQSIVNPINSKHLQLWIALLPITYLLTRYPTFLHARYVAVISVILILLFWCEIMNILRFSRTRIAILGFVLIFLLNATCFSNDPVTAAIFGRIPKENGQFYCFAAKDDKTWLRDAAVYNLQFAQLSRAIDDVLAIIKPNLNTIISSNETMLFAGRVLASLNPFNYKRTVNVENALLPKYFFVNDIQKEVSEGRFNDSIWYIGFPNTNWTEDIKILSLLFQKFTIIQKMDNNHILSLYKFENPIVKGH